MEKDKLLLISLDAFSREDASMLLTCPNFSRLAEGGQFVDQVETVYLSNTYPIHTSVVTGCRPDRHGIYDNAVPMPGVRRPEWYWYANAVKMPTLYGEAGRCGLKVASILWPVTAKAPIRYNIPEIVAKRKGQSQILLSLRSGSPLLQLREAIKYGQSLHGVDEPQLDDFSCSAMGDIIRRKNPDLMMLHLIDADTQKHDFGVDSKQAKDAVLRMDRRIGDLIGALDQSGMLPRTNVIIFSDHGMTEVLHSINPNRLLEPAGLAGYSANGSLDFWKIWIKCSGGSGFIYQKDSNDTTSLNIAREILARAAADPESGIAGFLDEDEFRSSGLYRECPFGIKASYGYEFVEYKKYAHRANHGYSIKDGKYNTFYLLNGPRIKSGPPTTGGSLLDIAPLAAELLNIPPWEMDGSLRSEFLAY